MIRQIQLRWAGHCIRMLVNRLPRQVLFAQLTHSVRKRGGQREQFKHTAIFYSEENPNWHQCHVNLQLQTVHFGAEAYTRQQPMWDKPSTSRSGETAEEKEEGDVSPSSRLRSIWHLLITQQQDLQIKNRALESPQDTWPTIRNI